MAVYRLYFFDRTDHICDVLEIDCDSDELARKAAPGYADGRAMELWERARLVARFEAPLRMTAGAR